jgi:O-antigen/teichoic acid export membrane protein
MLFQKVLYVTLVATTIGFAVTIALAYAGYGANSMAVGTVVTNVVTGFGAWVARGTQKVMLPSLSEWRKVASFGTQRSASGIAGTMSTDVSELVAGKLLGFAPVAMLSRAQGLMNLFQRDLMTAITTVAYPAFAKASRDNKNLEVKHVAAVAAITVVGWPFFGFVALFGLEILRLLFGRQWDEAAAFVPWYCLAGVVAAPSYLIVPLLTAIGRIDAATKIDLTVQPLRAVLFIFGLMSFPSINTPPVLFLIAASCATPYCYYMKGKALPNDMPKLLTSLAKSAAVTAASLILPVATILTLGRENGPLEFSWVLVAALLCAVSWFIAIYAIRHPITQDQFFKGALERFDALYRKIMK